MPAWASSVSPSGAAERAKARVELASTDTAGNGAIFNQAKAFAAEKKYNEALQTLNTLQTELLTPEQEKAVADLRAEIAKARG